MSQLTFSIVICNYNYQDYVGKAIESCVNQDFCKDLYEIIVVDDGSTDDSRKVIHQYSSNKNLKIILQENLGHSGAYKTGVTAASGEFICLLDSDDEFLPNKLTQVKKQLHTYQQPLPKYFFLSHDVTLLNAATGKPLDQSWFKRINLNTYGPPEFINYLDFNHTYPWSNPCGQIYSKELLNFLFNLLNTDEWRNGAENPISHGAALLCQGVHLIHEALALYRIHEKNFYISIDKANNQIKAKFDTSIRTKNLISFLNKLAELQIKNNLWKPQLAERCLSSIDILEDSLRKQALLAT